MIVLFRDSSINYWLDNSVVDCGNIDALNSNPEIVFPNDDDYETIAKQIKKLDENDTLNYSLFRDVPESRPIRGYKKNNRINTKTNNKKYNRTNTKTNNKKFEPVYYHE